MKKKILLATLAAACVMGGGAAVVGCNKGGEEGHSHTYSTEWTYNDTDHFHKCKYEGCNSITGSEGHHEAESTTATCTQAGVKTTYCIVEGCEWKKEEAQEALGHDWDEEHPVGEATHLHGATIKCKREGCTATKATATVPHDYEWTYKDSATHTGKCKDAGCAEVAPVEVPHKLDEGETVNQYTVYTCEDCHAELAEVSVRLIIDTGSEAAPGKAVKVMLYGYDEDSQTHVKVGETTSDAASGVATFLVKEGTYYAKVQDDEVFSHDVIPVKFVKNDVNERPEKKMVVGEKRHYTCTAYYGAGNGNPAANVDFKIIPTGYSLVNPLPVAEGKTDANGVFEFDFSDKFESYLLTGWRLVLSGYDTTDYKAFSMSVTNATPVNCEVHVAPQKLSYTVKVKAGDEFVDGVGVTLQYNDTEATATTGGDNHVADLGELDSNNYEVMLTLPEETAKFYKYKAITTSNYDGEVIIELIDKNPTYIIKVQSSYSGEWSKENVGIILKNAEGETVAQGVTDENGEYRVELPQENYSVYIVENTISEVFAYKNSAYQTTGTYVNVSSNSLECTVTLKEKITKKLIVCSSGDEGYVYHEGVKVKLLDGEEVFFEGDTDENGEISVTAGAYESFTLVLENLPSRLVCTTTSVSFYLAGDEQLTLSPSAQYTLQLKDEDGNAVAGATVRLVSWTYNMSREYYTETEKAKAITDSDGNVILRYEVNANSVYTLDIVGANGEKYWCNANLIFDAANAEYQKEITVHTYDNTLGFGSKVVPPFGLGGMRNVNSSMVGKETLVTVTSKRDERFIEEGLTRGKTYKISFNNPDDVALNIRIQYNNSYTDLTEDNDNIKFEKDENGKILSITYKYTGASILIYITHTKAAGEKGTEVFRLTVGVEEVTE